MALEVIVRSQTLSLIVFVWVKGEFKHESSPIPTHILERPAAEDLCDPFCHRRLFRNTQHPNRHE